MKLLLIFVGLLAGCGTTSNDVKMKMLEAQMAQNAHIHQMNNLPKYELRNCTGDCSFTVYKTKEEQIALNPVGLNETTAMDVLNTGLKELGATARQVAPYAAGAYAINKVTKAMSSTSTHQGDVIQGDKIGNDKVTSGDSFGDYANNQGDGFLNGENLGNTVGDTTNTDNTHEPAIVESTDTEVVIVDAPEPIIVNPQVVNPEIVEPTVIEVPGETQFIEQSIQ